MKTENINIENSENISKKDLTEKQLNLLISIADELDKEAKYETALEKLNEAFLKYENSEVFPELSANIKTDILFQIATLNLIIKNLQTSENYFIKVLNGTKKIILQIKMLVLIIISEIFLLYKKNGIKPLKITNLPLMLIPKQVIFLT